MPTRAAIMRRELDAAEKQYPLKKKMVVIGHSMGGCISRLMITDSEKRIWNELFTVPPEKMEMSPEHKHILTESTIFQHRPEICRVIFICAPLRGADLASGWLGRVGAKLVNLPMNALNIGKEMLNYRQPVTGHQHLKRLPTSVDSLSEKNEFVLAVQKLPLTPGIPASHHRRRPRQGQRAQVERWPRALLEQSPHHGGIREDRALSPPRASKRAGPSKRCCAFSSCTTRGATDGRATL